MVANSDRRMSFIGSKSSSIIFASFPTAADPGTIQVGTFTRSFAKISDTRFSVADAYKTWYNTSSADNTLCIPIAIYGIKQKINISLSAIAMDVSTSASKCMLSDGETSVEDALTWKYIGTASGNNKVAVNKTSGTYRVLAQVGSGACFCIDIPTIALSSNTNSFQAGAMYTSSAYSGVSIGATLSAIWCVQYYESGTAKTGQVTIRVYHKDDRYETS
jgi:hypothetical protein